MDFALATGFFAGLTVFFFAGSLVFLTVADFVWAAFFGGVFLATTFFFATAFFFAAALLVDTHGSGAAKTDAMPKLASLRSCDAFRSSICCSSMRVCIGLTS